MEKTAQNDEEIKKIIEADFDDLREFMVESSFRRARGAFSAAASGAAATVAVAAMGYFTPSIELPRAGAVLEMLVSKGPFVLLGMAAFYNSLISAFEGAVELAENREFNADHRAEKIIKAIQAAQPAVTATTQETALAPKAPAIN